MSFQDAGAIAAMGPHAAPYQALIEATGPFHPAMTLLEAIDAGPAAGALAERIAALRAIAKPIGWDITLTLDPTERHGFEYQSWFGYFHLCGGLHWRDRPGRQLHGRAWRRHQRAGHGLFSLSRSADRCRVRRDGGQAPVPAAGA